MNAPVVDRIDEYPPCEYPDWWKKCGGCPTLLPVDPMFGWGKAQSWHRTTAAGVELCSECSEATMDAEQEAAEMEMARQQSEIEALR